MNKPVIIINDQKIEVPELKARVWREIIKFDSTRKDIPTENFCEEHAKIIAMVFGLTVDEVLDKLNIEDILPAYSASLLYVVQLLSSKLGGDDTKKNVDVDAQT